MPRTDCRFCASWVSAFLRSKVDGHVGRRSNRAQSVRILPHALESVARRSPCDPLLGQGSAPAAHAPSGRALWIMMHRLSGGRRPTVTGPLSYRRVGLFALSILRDAAKQVRTVPDGSYGYASHTGIAWCFSPRAASIQVHDLPSVMSWQTLQAASPVQPAALFVSLGTPKRCFRRVQFCNMHC